MLQSRLSDIQTKIATDGYIGDYLEIEIELQAQLNIRLAQQNSFLLQKSRINWLKDGDHNTKFFHNSLRHSRMRNRIDLLEIDGDLVHDPNRINEHLISFYSGLFTEVSGCVADISEVRRVIPSLITQELSKDLVKLPTMEEVRAAVSK